MTFVRLLVFWALWAIHIYKHKMKQSKDIKNCILYPIQWMVFSKRAMVFCWPWSTLGWTKISLFSGRQTRFSEYIEQRKALLFYLFVSNKVAKSPVSKTANKPSIYDFSVSRSMRYTEVNVTSGFVAVLDSSIIFWPFWQGAWCSCIAIAKNWQITTTCLYSWINHYLPLDRTIFSVNSCNLHFNFS